MALALTLSPALTLTLMSGCVTEGTGGDLTSPGGNEVNTGLAHLGDEEPKTSGVDGDAFNDLNDDEMARMIRDSASLLGEVYGETPAQAHEPRISVTEPAPAVQDITSVIEITEVVPQTPMNSPSSPASLSTSSSVRPAPVEPDQSFIELVGHTPEPAPVESEFLTLLGAEPTPEIQPIPVETGSAGASGLTHDQLAAELSRSLREMVRDADDPSEAFRAATALAGLEAIRPGSIDRLEGQGVLSPEDLAVVKAAAELTRALGSEGRMTDPGHAADLLDELGDRLSSARGVRITTAALCTRVLGYGRYEEFPTHTFLAGRRQPVIIYAELDRFTHKPIVADDGGERFEIKLSQRLELYHLADGLNTWNRAADIDRSVSRKRVKDYYLINQVVLPDTLSVGKYTLKVVMRDLNDERGGVDEITIPIEIVSDPSLAYPNASRASATP